MKKLLTMILTLTLALAMAVPMQAAAGEVTISTSVDDSYEIVIPSGTKTIEWNNTEPQELGNIGLSKARLTPGKHVTITLGEKDDLVNSVDDTKKIPYAIKSGGNVFTSQDFDSVIQIPLTIVVEQSAWDAAPAGAYSDTVTFTATLS